MPTFNQKILSSTKSQKQLSGDCVVTEFSATSKQTGAGIIQGVGDSGLDFLLKQDGFYLLQQNGDRIILQG